MFAEFRCLNFGKKEFPSITIKIIKDITDYDIEADLTGIYKDSEEIAEEIRQL